jgi:hypothetical protein
MRILALCVLFISFCKPALAQQGKNSLALGLFYSLPLNKSDIRQLIEPGPGVEVTTEIRFRGKAAIVPQIGIASHQASEKWQYAENNKIRIISPKIGYRYYLEKPALYGHVMPGIDFYSNNEPSAYSIGLGAGKRFSIQSKSFFDIGIDLIASSSQNRINLKTAFGFYPKRKKTIIIR